MTPNHTHHRILFAMRCRGAVDEDDFLRTPTVDGGRQFKRLAARIGELRGMGYNIETRFATSVSGARYARYMLRGEVASDVPSSPASNLSRHDAASPEGTSEPASLFELPAHPSGHYGDTAA